MFRYIAQRLLLAIPVAFCVLTLVFFLLRLIPGDPVDMILGENALPQARDTLTKAFAFDRPVMEQYGNYLQDLSKGNLGRSYFSQDSVNGLLWSRFGATCQLAAASMFWAILFSFPLGVLAASKKESLADRGVLALSLLGISIPTFYLGPLLALVFAIKLDWFPVSGSDQVGAIILPSLTLGLAMTALLARFTRASVLQVLDADYVRTARAKGLHEVSVLLKHALRSALTPIIAVLGLQLGTLMAGTVVTEKIFGWPGLGTLMLDSITRRDYALVQGCVLLIALTYVLVNAATDVVQGLLDPRFRVAG